MSVIEKVNYSVDKDGGHVAGFILDPVAMVIEGCWARSPTKRSFFRIGGYSYELDPGDPSVVPLVVQVPFSWTEDFNIQVEGGYSIGW